MISLMVDLETDWRGGQNQALLTVKGLRDCGGDAQLVAIGDSPLAQRAAQAGVKVHAVNARAVGNAVDGDDIVRILAAA